MSLLQNIWKYQILHEPESKIAKNKIKLYSIYTEETVELKDIFMRSLQDDWEVNLVYWGKAGEDGNWGTKSFGKLMRRKIEFLIDNVEKNWGDVIIFSDIDIQFFGECNRLIEVAIQNNDVLFQSEYWPGKNINAGFIVTSCNHRALNFFKSVAGLKLEGLKFFEQSAMNELLKNDSIDLRWDVLPSQFWARSQGDKPPLDIVLHHANCTIPSVKDGKKIGSMDLKLEQYKMVREYLLTEGKEVPGSI